MVEDGGAESGERSEVAIEREREKLEVFLCKGVWCVDGCVSVS
jgi:hypothetical protein